MATVTAVPDGTEVTWSLWGPAGLAPTGAALAKLIPELHPGAHLVRIAETTPGHYDITVKFPGTIEHACTGPLADGTHDRLQHTTATLPT